MSKRDEERAAGFLFLLLIYVVYTVVMYVNDKLKPAYNFILASNSLHSDDVIFWLIVAIVAVCFWYLCYFLGRRKKAKQEAEIKQGVTKSEPPPKYENEVELISNKKERKYEPIAEPPQHKPAPEPASKTEVATATTTIVDESVQALSYHEEDLSGDPTFAIWSQLRKKGIEIPSEQIENRLKLVTEMLHIPEEEARRSTLNFFIRYGQPEAQHGPLVTDFYRSPEWLALSRQIRERDRFTCQQCKKYGPNGGGELHVHHIIPRGKGGSNDPSNLITLCANCHALQPYHDRLKNH